MTVTIFITLLLEASDFTNPRDRLKDNHEQKPGSAALCVSKADSRHSGHSHRSVMLERPRADFMDFRQICQTEVPNATTFSKDFVRLWRIDGSFGIMVDSGAGWHMSAKSNQLWSVYSFAAEVIP